MALRSDHFLKSLYGHGRQVFCLLTVIFYFSQGHVRGQCSTMAIRVNTSASCSPALFKFWIENAPKGAIVDWYVGNDTVVGSDTFELLETEAGFINASAIVTVPPNKPCNRLNAYNIARVYKVPEPTFSISKTTLCGISDTFTLIDLTPNAALRIWIIEGQNNLTKNKTSVHKFTSNGSKDIIVLVEDSFGCRGVKSFSNVAQVFETNDLDIMPDAPSYCLNSGVKYSSNVNQSTWDIASVKWTFPGGTPSTGNSLVPPTVKYTKAGSYDVSLEVFTKQGCRLFKEVKNVVRLVDTVKLELMISDSLLCLDDKAIVIVTDTSLKGNFIWNFPGSDSVEIMNPKMAKIAYEKAGNYPMQLIYKDSFCTSNLYKPIFVTAKKVQARFTSKDHYNCVLPFTVHFENLSIASESGTWKYTWTYFDEKNNEVASSNKVNDSIRITKMGLYSVELKAEHSSGCTGLGYLDDWIRADSTRLKFHAEYESVCLGQPISVVNMTLESAYLNDNTFKWWIYQADSARPFDSSTALQPYFVAKYDGKYDVRGKAINALGCFDESTERKLVKVIKPEIRADVITKDNVCKPPAIITFKSDNIPDKTIYDHHWRLTDGVTSYEKYSSGDTILVHATGVYDLIYDIALGGYCRDTLVMKNRFYISGVEASLNLAEKVFCRNQPVKPRVTVKNTLHNTTNDTVKYTWFSEPLDDVTIIDGDSAKPTFFFKKDGQYVIRAFFYNSLGCYSNAYSDTITIGLSPRFKFKDSTVCADAPMAFVNISDSFANSFSHLLEPAVSHSLSEIAKDSFEFSISKNGNYLLKLIVGHDSFCFDTVVKNIQILKPVADFYKIDSNLYCAPSYQRFVSTSSFADTMFWDFGDGKTLKTTNPKLATMYMKNSGSADPFDVRLIAKNRTGCSDTLIKKDFVMVKGPMAKFDLINNSGCEPLEVTFNGISANVTTLFLDYGDGTTFGTSFNKGHVYNNYIRKRIQQYNPMVLVIDDLGCVNTYTPDSIVQVRPSPVSDLFLTVKKGCVPLKTEYYYYGKDAKSWYWDFNGDKLADGSRANGFWTYDVGGLYDVALYTQNDFGCYDTAFSQVQAIAIPKAQIGFNDPLCLNTAVQIIDKSIYGTAPLQRDWAITDDKIYNIPVDSIVNFSFKTAGQKAIELSIKDEAGCSHDTLVYLSVKDSLNSEKAVLNAVTVLNDGTINIIPSKPLLPYLRSEIWKQGILGVPELKLDTFTKDAVNLIFIENTDAESHCYQIRHVDSCGFRSEVSDWHCSILLKVNSTVPFVNDLTWTPYIGWPVTTYTMYRSDGGPFVVHANVNALNGNTYSDTGLCNKDYCYFIAANGSQIFHQSQSNRVCKTPLTNQNVNSTRIESVSVNEADNLVIKLSSSVSKLHHYEIHRYSEDFFPSFLVLNSYADEFEDNIDLNVNKYSYTYLAKAIDNCTDMGTWENIGKSILLIGRIESDTSWLTWTAYRDWPAGVDHYSVYINTLHGLQKIGEVRGADTTFKTSEKFSDVAGAYCYRVLAVAAHDTSITSQSNQVCLVSKGYMKVPNAFTPDGDGLNDLFKPVLLFTSNPLLDPTGVYEFSIFNRWGELIFQSNNPETGWDGTIAGTKVTMGVYIYSVRAKAIDGSMMVKKGSFSLLR